MSATGHDPEQTQVPPPAASPRWGRAFRLRVLSAMVMTPVAVLAIYYGTPWFEAMVCLAAFLMAREWAHVAAPAAPRTVVLAFCAAATGLTLLGMSALSFPLLALLLAAVALGIGYLGRGRGLASGRWIALGVFVVALPCMTLVWLRGNSADGRMIVLWLMLVVWATDTGAYFVGRIIGGPKLAPRISPNKTWAGLLGGMLAAFGVGVIVAVFGTGQPLLLGLLSAALAVAAQAGDLAESGFKRHFGVKDSGGLIPGHGGILDRVDGLLTTAPLVAALIWLGLFTW